MAQFAATGKNPPWARGAGATLAQTPAQAATAALGTSLLAAQATPHPAPAATPALAAGVPTGPGLAAVVAAQTQQATQQAPPASGAFPTSLISLTQSALQSGAVLPQTGIALPVSLSSTAPVGTVTSGMVVELARLPQPGLALPTTLATTQVATVSYPTPRIIQTTQFQPPQPHAHQAVAAAAVAAAAAQQQQQQQQQAQPQQQPPPPKQRVFTGVVTKLHDNFGFVDEDVFFQISVVKGSMPKVGERVLVEASYNANMPFKWNATRIQVLPNQLNVHPTNNTRAVLTPAANMNAAAAAAVVSAAASVGLGVGSLATIAGPVQAQYGNVVAPGGRWPVTQDITAIEPIAGPRLSGTLPPRRHSPPPPVRRDREARREERRERYRERDYERERYSPPVRKRSRSPRRTSRSPPPRRRIRIVPRYTVQVPKISLDLKEGNVMELRKRYSNLYIPSDFCCASFLWQEAFPPDHPFLLDHPCSFHIMHKDVDPVVENDAVLEPPDSDHTFSAKVMLISTPSLKEIFRKSCALAEDLEENRDNFVHPTRLISFLVGLKGKNETVAIGGPWSPSLDGPNPEEDPQVLIKTAIRTCKALTGIDLGGCSQWYRFAEIHYRRGESSHKGRTTCVETVVLFLPDIWSCLPTRLEWDSLAVTYKAQLQKKMHDDTGETSETQEEEEGNHVDEVKQEPTHHSELDPKIMKVADLKKELEARNLSTKGLKSQLIARLTKALKTESEKEEQGEQPVEQEEQTEDGEKLDSDDVDDEKKKKQEEEKKQKDEKERATQERRYQLPESPSIIVHPSRKAKAGKFDCAVMSLSLLLDYRQEDNKEHSFEVSLFVELFNEMLMRDFGFRIYQALYEAPEQKDEEKEKKKGVDKKEDKKERKVLRGVHYQDEKDDHRKKEDADNDTEKDEEESDEDDDNEDEEKKDKDKRKKKRKKVQTYTANPYLLLAFVYFDQTHCGYLLDKDLEEILFTLGLQLSRAQVRKLVQKVVKRETLHYRKITDRPQNEPSKSAKGNDTDVNKSLLQELSLGNRRHLPVFKNLTQTSKESQNTSEVKGIVENGVENTPDNNKSLVRFNGAWVDVGKLLQQLERSEKARTDTERKLKELEEELEEVHETASMSERSAERLSVDLDEQRQRLRHTEDELRRAQSQGDKHQRMLVSCREKLHGLLSSVESALRTKSSRSSSSRSSDSLNSNGSKGETATQTVRREDENDLKRIKIDTSEGDS